MIGNVLIFSRTLILLAALAGEMLCAAGQQISTLPSEETQYRKANPQMVWGETTNFLRMHLLATNLPANMRSALDVRSGGVIVLSGRPLKPVKPAHLFVENAMGSLNKLGTIDSHTGTEVVFPDTNVVSIYLPPVHQRIALSLTDPEGAPVPKTREGAKFGAPLALGENTPFDKSRSEIKRKRLWRTGVFSRGFVQVYFSDELYLGISLPTNKLDEISQLDPTKYFLIKKPGLYKLTATVRFYVHGTNDFLMPITLPPISVDVRVEQND